jgi:cytochrome c biogenesis protein
VAGARRGPSRRGPGAVSLAAETGRLRETGNLLFHVSLIGVLLALATGSLYAYRGEALVVEGESFSNVLPAYDSVTPGARFDASALPPFTFRLDSLDVRFEEQQASEIGSPRDFAADVTWREDVDDEGRPGHGPGQQPARGRGHQGVPHRQRLRPRGGGSRQPGAGAGVEPVPFLPSDASYTSTGVVKAPVPDGDDLALSGVFLPTARRPGGRPGLALPDARAPRLVLTAWTGDIGLGDGSPAVGVRAGHQRDGAGPREDGEPLVLVLEPGQTAELPGGLGSVTFSGLPRFAAFQVRADPSGPLALVAAVLAMVGLVVSLFLPRRRVWVRLTAQGEGGGPGVEAEEDPGPGAPGHRRTLVQVGALSRSRDAGLAAEVDRVLAAALGARAARPADPDAMEPEDPVDVVDPGEPGGTGTTRHDTR